MQEKRNTMVDYEAMMKEGLPPSLRVIARINKVFPTFRHLVEWATHKRLKALAARPDGTLGWYSGRNDMRISAFYGSYGMYDRIPGWDVDMPEMRHDAPHVKLDHGYDESKARLDLDDLRGAATFRGGACTSATWSGDLYETLKWKCAFGHEFSAKPYTVLKAGHWCPQCLAPPWNYDEIAKKNPFFAQVWYPNHSKDEHHTMSLTPPL
jgi:hypothetical protein